jgi:hypothetical protein
LPTPAANRPIQLDEDYPPLTNDMQARLDTALRQLAADAGLEDLPGPAPVENLLEAVRQRLTPRDPATDLGKRLESLAGLKQPEQQLRGLLWAFGVEGYGDRRLNPVELVERLQKKLQRIRPLPKEAHER